MKIKLFLIFCLLWGGILGSTGCTRPARPQQTLVVAAASDLDPALRDIAAAFQQEHQVEVSLNFASTGTLVRQAGQGAPFDLLLAANETYIATLEQQHLLVAGSGRVYGQGRLVVWQNEETAVRVKTLNDLTLPEVKRIALANPEHAPYGQAAVEAFKKAGLYEAIKPKLIYGENVSQALQFAQTGNAEVALVAFSLTVNKPGRWFEVDAALYAPIQQKLGILRTTRNEAAARALADFITEGKGKEVLARYGFR
ncbi:MAG: molybdate ABC transporter substrate-binding protein [Blastocatellia bacterium]|nr:molybdate ABC transporter substrate-binding protein [Blastocatellia bacterium]